MQESECDRTMSYGKVIPYAELEYIRTTLLKRYEELERLIGAVQKVDSTWAKLLEAEYRLCKSAMEELK